jgi:copper chaperone CopZ
VRVTVYDVLGMTAERIALDVTAQLVDLPGVVEVVIDLDERTAEVVGQVSRERIRRAVREAGCDLAGS